MSKDDTLFTSFTGTTTTSGWTTWTVLPDYDEIVGTWHYVPSKPKPRDKNSISLAELNKDFD